LARLPSIFRPNVLWSHWRREVKESTDRFIWHRAYVAR